MIASNVLDLVDIDKDAPLPLYHQVRAALMTLITEGELKEGNLIPTEREIGEKLQVSRITVRRAIDELVREGYLVTQQGKGTFVARPKIERRTTQMKGFSEQMLEEGHKPGSQLLSLRHEKATAHVAAILQIKSDEWIWVVERLRYANDEPICISLTYLNLPLEVVLTPTELQRETSLWTILEGKGIRLKRSEATVQAIPAGDREAEVLHIETGSPLLLVEGVVYTEDNIPVEYHQMFNRGDRYKYSIQSSR
ncbi:MAG: GntR family transcriptional regulator [Anaerolineales bacterium]|nr:GntR family transcriptional regulator [Anaerolineales bacterium]